MLKITYHYRKANQNYSEIPLHTIKMAIIKKKKSLEITSLEEDVKKLEHLCITGGSVK